MNEKIGFKALLLDIEGTTTSISFVKEVLFPYAAQNVDKFLSHHISHCPASDVKEVVESLIELSNQQHQLQSGQISAVDGGEETESIVAKLALNVKTWIEQDKKLTAVKQLQGLMWHEAYVTGEIKGHVYEDVAMALEKFQSLGIPTYIFSSGSVQAQKLLFQHTHYGDLTKFLSGYFDTNIGAKIEPLSYTKISKEIDVEETEILFATDMEKEAIAACEAGMDVVLVIRQGNAPLNNETEKKFRIIHSLKEIIM